MIKLKTENKKKLNQNINTYYNSIQIILVENNTGGNDSLGEKMMIVL